MKDCFPTANFRAVSWKWVTDCWNVRFMWVFPGTRVSPVPHSSPLAPRWLHFYGCDQCGQSSLENSATAPAAVTFWKGVELHFSSDCRRKKRSLQVLCEEDEIFIYLLIFPSFWKEGVSQAEEITLPMAKNNLGPCRGLTPVLISQWELWKAQTDPDWPDWTWQVGWRSCQSLSHYGVSGQGFCSCWWEVDDGPPLGDTVLLIHHGKLLWFLSLFSIHNDNLACSSSLHKSR